MLFKEVQQTSNCCVYQRSTPNTFSFFYSVTGKKKSCNNDLETLQSVTSFLPPPHPHPSNIHDAFRHTKEAQLSELSIRALRSLCVTWAELLCVSQRLRWNKTTPCPGPGGSSPSSRTSVRFRRRRVCSLRHARPGGLRLGTHVTCTCSALSAAGEDAEDVLVENVCSESLHKLLFISNWEWVWWVQDVCK